MNGDVSSNGSYSELRNDYLRKTKYCLDDESADTGVHLGSFYMVKRKDGEWARAEIIQRRYNAQASCMEYFVHYEYQDKRLDEWVTAKRIVVNGGRGTDWSDEESVDVDSGESQDESQMTGSQTPSDDTLIDAKEITPPDSDTETLRDSDDVEEEHKAITKVKYINVIQFGSFEIYTWYFSPYPEEYGLQEKLYICEYCLKYMRLEKTYRYHMSECTLRAPPGTEVYRKGILSIHEVDPLKNRLYCQNLCLMAKLFIDHKTIFYDVDSFMFYILCEIDKHGSHLRGFFSKERDSIDGHNVACILTLPPFQRQGFGKLLIGFSYELSKIEGVVGTPEKPLSDLGQRSYRSYWAWVILNNLRDFNGLISIKELSETTSITESDILSTLESMNIVKYWLDDNTVVISHEMMERHVLSSKFRRPRFTIDRKAISIDTDSYLARSKRPTRLSFYTFDDYCDIDY